MPPADSDQTDAFILPRVDDTPTVTPDAIPPTSELVLPAIDVSADPDGTQDLKLPQVEITSETPVQQATRTIPPIHSAVAEPFDPSELHLRSASVTTGRNGKPVVSSQPLPPGTTLDANKPTLIILSGIRANQNNTGIMNIVIAKELKHLGGVEIAADKINAVTVTYPDFTDDPAAFRQYAMNGDKGFSPLAAKLSTAIIGDVRDYNSMTPTEQAAEVRRLQGALRTKVISGMSMGSYMADGLSQAMVYQLEQRGFPPSVIAEQIMPNLKVVTYSEIGVQQRGQTHKPTGVSAIHMANHADEILYTSRDLQDVGFKGVSAIGEAEGTVKANIGPNEVLMMVTLPENYVTEASYDPAKHNKPDIIVDVRDGKSYALTYGTNTNGHDENAFVKPYAPTPGQNGRLSQTEVTGYVIGNTLRGAMQDSFEASAAIQEGRPLPPVPDMQALIDTPHPSLLHTGPDPDPVVVEMEKAGYKGHMQSITVEGEHSWQDVATGKFNSDTQAAKAALELIGQQRWMTAGDGRDQMYAIDMAGKSPQEQRALMLALREQGIVFTQNTTDTGDTRLVISDGIIPYEIVNRAERLDSVDLLKGITVSEPETLVLSLDPVQDPSVIDDDTRSRADQITPISDRQPAALPYDPAMAADKQALYETMVRIRDGDIVVTPSETARANPKIDVDMIALAKQVEKLQQAYPNQWLDVPLIEGDPKSTVRALNGSLETSINAKANAIKTEAEAKAKANATAAGTPLDADTSKDYSIPVSPEEKAKWTARVSARNIVRIAHMGDEKPKAPSVAVTTTPDLEIKTEALTLPEVEPKTEEIVLPKTGESNEKPAQRQQPQQQPQARHQPDPQTRALYPSVPETPAAADPARPQPAITAVPGDGPSPTPAGVDTPPVATPSGVSAVPDAPVVPRTSTVTIGGSIGGAGFGLVQTYNNLQQGDVVGTAISGTDVVANGIVIADEVSAVRGLSDAGSKLGIVGKVASKAAIPLAVLTTAYDAYKETGTSEEDKYAYKAARVAAGGAALGTGVLATAGTVALVGGATVATAGVAGVTAVVAVPLAAAVAVGYTASEAIDISKQYAIMDKQFAATQDNRNIEAFKYSIFTGTGQESRELKKSFVARGAKFEEGSEFTLDLNDPKTREILREEIIKRREENTQTIDSYVFSPRWNPLAGQKSADKYNAAIVGVKMADAALIELDNYTANRKIMLAKRAADEAKRVAEEKAAAEKAARVAPAIKRIDRNNDGNIELLDLDRNGDNQVDLRDYVDKDGNFTRESLEELKKDVAALEALSKEYPGLVPLRDGLKQLAQTGEDVLSSQEKAMKPMKDAVARLDKNGDGEFKLSDLDRNGDGKINIADYANDNKVFDRNSLAEMRKDIAALDILAKNIPELASVRDQLTQEADRAEQLLVKYEKSLPAPAAAPQADSISYAPASDSAATQQTPVTDSNMRAALEQYAAANDQPGTSGSLQIPAAQRTTTRGTGIA